MKHPKIIRKRIALTLANYIPVLCAYLFYQFGGPVIGPIFIACQLLISVLNYRCSGTKSELIYYCVNLVLSTIIANVLSTYFYYHRISSDTETLLVGGAALRIGLILVLAISIYSICLKKKRSEKQTTAENKDPELS